MNKKLIELQVKLWLYGINNIFNSNIQFKGLIKDGENKNE
ncbi:unnamed protein product [marine sediment metagenome]|uniref:Uncharacterized protein n=1 Tax=marine sediment metagenome TaxID=412755 RepID=X0W450_9ZZZZ